MLRKGKIQPNCAVSMYLFGLVNLVVDNKHGRGDGIVSINNWHDVQTYQLGQGAEEVLAGLFVVKIRFRHQHLNRFVEVSNEKKSAGE